MEMFVAVVEEKSVCAASKSGAFATQPAVSIAIRKLHEEFEVALFDRSKRYDYRLTQAGEAMLTYASRIAGLRNETETALRDICNLRAGRLRIGANESISLYLLPRLLEAFLKRHAGIRMEVLCEGSESLLTDLRDRKLDLALLSFKPDDCDLEAEFVMQDELVLVTHPSHFLAHKETFIIQDFSEESLLVVDVSRPLPWHHKIADAFIHFKPPPTSYDGKCTTKTIKKMVGAQDLGSGSYL